MKKRWFFGAIGVCLMIIVLVFLIGFVNSELISNRCNSDCERNKEKHYSDYEVRYIEKNECTPESPNYPCFKYPELDQKKWGGEMRIPEQIHYSPCPKPKKPCTLCRDGLEQVKEHSDMKELEQIHENC